MRQTFGFLFFMLFLAGFAFVILGNLKSAESLREQSAAVTIISGSWLEESAVPAGQDAMSVRFHADGKISGFAGCNNFFGSFVATDKTLDIGPLGATRMACAPPLMRQETDFLLAIESATAYAIDGSTLTLGDGEKWVLHLILTPKTTVNGT